MSSPHFVSAEVTSKEGRSSDKSIRINMEENKVKSQDNILMKNG